MASRNYCLSLCDYTPIKLKGKAKTHSPCLQGIVRSILIFCDKIPYGNYGNGQPFILSAGNYFSMEFSSSVWVAFSVGATSSEAASTGVSVGLSTGTGAIAAAFFSFFLLTI